MNILIPHSWLLEHLETKATPDEIQKLVSLSGPSIERIYQKEGESVYDIEVTTNRVDSMSVRGIARESAVILEEAGISANLKKLVLADEVLRNKPDNALPLPKITNDPRFCKRVMCIILKDVQRTPTPEWMAKRLLQIDQHVHDSVIDITNYITHELGHPCHAFDYDKVMKLGGEIIVKEATKGKKFTTLDGIAYTTVGGEIVFENAHGEIIDLPAIKGTANTSIDASTKNVLFWIESLDAKKVRFTSMTHAIRTVAAQLNEKKVDPELAEDVLLKGVELYQQLCHAQIGSALFDEYPGKAQPAPIKVKLSSIEQYLGVKLETQKMVSILEKLDCQAVVEGDILEVTPPTFRPDLEIPADIVEEIARIYGYHNLPSVIMPTAIPVIKPENVDFSLENKIKHFLSDIGWQEVYTYSMVSEAIALQSGMSLTEHLKLQNPLTDDRVFLRRSLIPSLIEVLDQNPERKTLSLFEIAHTYTPKANQVPDQQLYLALVSSEPFAQVKGDLETLLQRFFIEGLTTQPHDHALVGYAQSGSLQVNSDGKTTELGTIGVLKSGQTAITIPVVTLLKVAQSHPAYQPAPKTAVVIEDLTFTFPEKTLLGEVMKSIKKVSTLIRSVELKDSYQQNFTLTITYYDPAQNLTSAEIEPLRKKVSETVSSEFKAILIGKV